MTELRCKPGDLAVVVRAEYPVNLGRIVRVIRRDQGRGILFYAEDTPAWLAVSARPMTWYVDGKRIQRKSGPVPDAQLQPIRGLPLGSDIAESLGDETEDDQPETLENETQLKGSAC